MNTHEFIVKNVQQQLEKAGYQAAIAMRAANDALDYYLRTARFKRSAIEDCVKFAKKRAKEMQSVA